MPTLRRRRPLHGTAGSPGDEGSRTGIYMLDHVDIFNLLCIPSDTRTTDVPATVWSAATEYCAERRAMVIIDPPSTWSANAKTGNYSKIQPTDLGVAGDIGRNAAVYFPKVKEIDPFMGGTTQVVPACGIIAGVYATTDATRGVWKAPAGVDAALVGIDSLEINLTDAQNGDLNQSASTACAVSQSSGRWSGARARCEARIFSRTITSTFPFGGSRSTSKRVFIAAPSSRFSNPTTRRCGRSCA